MLFSFSGCRICRDPPAAAPPAGKFPMRTERVRRACRNTGGGAGGRAIGGGCGSNGRQGKRPRPSGCDRPRLRMPMRMRGTRRARYLQTLLQPYSYADISLCRICYRRICLCRICHCSYYTQIFSTAAYLTQPYSYAEYAYAEYAYAAILRRYSLHKYSLRRNITYAHITHPLLCPHPPHLTPSNPIPSCPFPTKKIYKRKAPPPLSALTRAPSLRSGRPPSLRPLASLAWRSG